MSRRPIAATAALLLTLSIGVTACGSDDAKPDKETTTTTRPDSITDDSTAPAGSNSGGGSGSGGTDSSGTGTNDSTNGGDGNSGGSSDSGRGNGSPDTIDPDSSTTQPGATATP